MFKISTVGWYTRLQLLGWSLTALSMTFSGKADQNNHNKPFLASVAACDETPAFFPTLIIQLIEVR